MYDVTPNLITEYHHGILDDEVRTQSFLRAILKTVKPGDVVLDMGCGTGILSYFACLAGARQVYAVEQGPVIELARSICRQNGYQDRVAFVNDWSTNIELPEPVDVIVTETIGNAGFDEGILGWVMDARERFLAEGDRIIPHSVALAVVPVENPDDYDYLDRWGHGFCGFDFSLVRKLAVNNLLWTALSSRSFLSEPATAARVEMSRVSRAEVSGEASIVVKRAGMLHGIGGWFIAELSPGQTISNAPPNQTPSWNHAFLPLERPLPVRAGDRLLVQLKASANAAQWRWQVTCHRGGNGRKPAQDVIPLEQTTLSGELWASTDMQSLDHRPKRNEDGEIDLFILQLMDGDMSIEEITRRTVARFPAQFNGFEHTLERVISVSEDYGRWSDNEPESVDHPINQTINLVKQNI